MKRTLVNNANLHFHFQSLECSTKRESIKIIR